MNAVEFERVSKSYALYDRPGDRLRELLTGGRRSYHRDFHAVRDLTFAIKRGEVFCIVGENGSGKSTTLQLIAGILQPASGSIGVNGRVSALLELGAGFNPEFTGRDNVYLNASILGLSKSEIDRRYKMIEDFAGIGDFIGRPVKTYSSGMVVRLAFAVAINVDPEVLLVDEALAVGDASFRHSCMRKVHELRDRGVTIVFVSHAIADVQAIGDRVLWLEHGRAIACGSTDVVLPRYLAAMTERAGPDPAPDPATTPDVAAESLSPIADSIPNVDHRHGDGRAEILGIAILNEYAEPLHLMMPQSRIVIRITFRANRDLSRPAVGFMLRNHLGLDFTETDTDREGHPLPPMRKGEVSTVDFTLDIPEFYPGAFSFSPSVSDGSVCDWIDNAVTVQMARGEGPVYGYLQVPCKVELNAEFPLLEFTGERVIPGLVDPDLLNEHVARYRFAARFAEHAHVLDAGCGSGYGTAELANAEIVVGIDVSADAIAHARRIYSRPGVHFLQGACESLPFADASFDLVVAFEVIEHLEGWRRMLDETRRVLRPSGVLLVSTPNKAWYNESRAAAGPNPFHVREFEYREFEAALEAKFPHVRLWTQNHTEAIAFVPVSPSSGVLDVPADSAPENAHFFLAACSQAPIAEARAFAWMPASGNALRERLHHISLLESEIERKNEWLAEAEQSHAKLQKSHENALAELRESNAWAARLNGELEVARAVMSRLESEAGVRLDWIRDLEAQIARGRAEIARLGLERGEMESTIAERTQWAQSLDVEVERLRIELERVRTELQMLETAKLVRLGRKLSFIRGK